MRGPAERWARLGGRIERPFWLLALFIVAATAVAASILLVQGGDGRSIGRNDGGVVAVDDQAPAGAGEGERVAADVAGAGQTEGSSQEFAWPVEGWIVQGMSAQHPSGIDVGLGAGAPVHAVRGGRVIFAGGDPCCSYGYFVIVEHDERWASLYAHFSAFEVQMGEQVQQGQVIGLAGDTGKANGPHLHFELRSYGAPVDPFDYLPYRADMRPPPVALVEASEPAPAGGGAGGAEAPEPGTTLESEQAIALAISWFASNGEAAYAADATSCQAVRLGPNWIVTCDGVLQGCAGTPDCYRALSACVLEQPLLVTETCA